MADLTPTILEATDTTIYNRATGRVRHVKRTTFMLGELGPFTVDIEREKFDEYTLRAEMDKVAATLRPFA